MTDDSSKDWMVGLPEQPDLLSLQDLRRLIGGGKILETDLVRRSGGTWHAARDVTELGSLFSSGEDIQRKTRRRPLKEIPPPEPEPELVPESPGAHSSGAMEGKYFSPTDLLRALSHGLAPRNILLSAFLLIPTLGLAFFLRDYIQGDSARYGAMTLVVGVGVSGIAFVLAHVTRFQVEGRDPRVGGSLGWMLRRISSVLLLPLISFIPAVALFGLLYLMGRMAESSDTAAQTIRILYFVPVLTGLLLVGCGILLELLLIMVPACMVVENVRLGPALKSVGWFVRTQFGRVLLHWLVITVGCSLSYRILSWVVGKGFAFAADMTGNLLGRGETLFSFYAGMREGLSLAVPVSLFVTMSVLSFLVLREEDMEYLPGGDSSEPEETHPSTTG